jgi:galactokinase
MEMSCTSPELPKTAERLFREKFSRRPRWMVAAPGRVNLIGEHTDYNDGFVLPMAIERYVVIAADRPAENNGQTDDVTARLFSTAVNGWARISISGRITPGPVSWSSYMQGVVAGCLAAGLAPGRFDAVVHADVPVGGGLSSSAALEVATATLVEAMTGRTIEPLAKALLCQKAEHEYAGMPCGIMDQFSSVMGRQDHLMLIDCRAQRAEMVPLRDPDVSVLIINTNVKHELTGGEYAQRRAQCESAAGRLGVPALRDATTAQLEEARNRLEPVEYRRARHVIGEIERTVEAARAVGQGDWTTVGRLMYASHASLRDDYEVSCAELDQLVELAASLGNESGVIGSRMTGGGFGGCTVSLVRTDALERVVPAISGGYQKATGIEPTVFVTRPAEGARILPLDVN